MEHEKPCLPDDIERLAAQRGLGGLVDVREGMSRIRAVITGGCTAVVSAVAIWLLTKVPGATSMFSWIHSLARAAAFVLFWAIIWGIGIALRGLLVGSRACYLFEGGLVGNRRGGLRAVAWSEVVALKSVYQRRQGNEGKVAGYRVETRDGGSLAVPLVLIDGRDAFVDRIVCHTRAHGCPIE